MKTPTKRKVAKRKMAKMPTNQHDTIPELVTGLWDDSLKGCVNDTELAEKLFGHSFTDEEKRWCRLGIMYLTQAQVVMRAVGDAYMLTTLGRKVRSHHKHVTRNVLRLWSKAFVRFDVPGPSSNTTPSLKPSRRLKVEKIKNSVKALESVSKAKTGALTSDDKEEKFRLMITNQREIGYLVPDRI